VVRVGAPVVGVDIGGTYTDLVLHDEASGETHVGKIRSTPDDPTRALVAGLDELAARAGVQPDTVRGLFHGTTIATNSVLEHDGARVGLITTRGFRDVVHIGRHQRPLSYSVAQQIPLQSRPLVRRCNRKVVRERIVPPGHVDEPLDEDDVREAARELAAAGCDAIAIGFLHAYLDPSHERRAAQIVSEILPDAFVTTSAEVAPEFREFERFTTTCLNAFVGPRSGRYLERLSGVLETRGGASEVHVMTSNGGLASAAQAARRPVSLLLSGPAAGVLGGRFSARRAGRDRLVTFDVGGTSADIGIATAGGIEEASARDGLVAGYPVLLPMLAIHSIGAGGGSIARLDAAGGFRVGPHSAGAVPGPACYGLGGTEPTVTDACVALGRLPAAHMLAGSLRVNADAAHAALTPLARALGTTVLEIADGVVRVANANMAAAIRSRTVERGLDPRSFALVAFGGAGPMHAAEVADLVGIREILIPPYPGITSAIGLVTSDLKYDRTRTLVSAGAAIDAGRVNAVLDELECELRATLAGDGVDPGDCEVARALDCRYAGQGYELRVPLGDGAFTVDDLDAFHAIHEREFQHVPAAPIEIVNARVTAFGRRSPVERLGLTARRASAERLVTDLAIREGGRLIHRSAPVIERNALHASEPIAGPAVVVQDDATTFVPPTWCLRVEPSGCLVLEVGDA
jgi:N-methylhydantoinase A